MAGKTIYKLGNVHMPYAAFEWPKYRGVNARLVEFDCPAAYFAPLKALAISLGGGSTTLTVTGPSRAGETPGDVTVPIGGVFIDRVVQMSEALTRVYLYDARYLLSRFVFARDFNIKFGSTYLNGTEFNTFQRILREAIDSNPYISNAFDSFVNPTSFDAPNDIHLAGLPFAHGLADALDRAGMSLTVSNDGELRIVDMGDVSDSSILPNKTAYSWAIEPGWAHNQAYICGRPQRIIAYYHERHCLKLEFSSAATVAHSGPEELRVELEQVYKSKDANGNPVYYTLSELLVAYGFNATDLTDDSIAQRYMSRTFQGTPIYTVIENDNAKAVINAIHESWRTLWRIKFVGQNGALGGWTDWAFGKINADGSTQAVAVECPWVEFLNDPSPIVGQNGDTFIGSVTTVNHAAPAPFTAAWEGGDLSLGIISLSQKELRDGNFAVPGALRNALQVKEVVKIEDGYGASEGGIEGYDYVEMEDRAKADFTGSTFTLAIYVCATRRMPNNETRWHNESVSAFGDGDIPYIELPVSEELKCIRNYIGSTDSGDILASDGLGPYRNAAQIAEDAEARAEVWKATHASGVDGFGVAESIMAFRDIEVRGPIAEVILEADGEQVQTRIVAGNLADNEARLRKAQKRLAERRFKTAGAA